jgi:hypothetical protein
MPVNTHAAKMLLFVRLEKEPDRLVIRQIKKDFNE